MTSPLLITGGTGTLSCFAVSLTICTVMGHLRRGWFVIGMTEHVSER